MSVKVRVAPSPTGNLHIGRAQSALFNWLFAKRYGGQFFLRIEDTDQERSKKEFEQPILDGLRWLGIQWDNEKVPRSTENAAAYRKSLESLLASDKAFWCHHTMEELEEERQAQQKNKELPRHVCSHKHSEQGKTPGGIIRLAVDSDSDRIVEFDDLIRGPIKFEARLLGDVSIARSLDSALYHMAVTCDDIVMEITHVLRGEDHISNTPKQILIYEALGQSVPRFGHLPLLLGSDRSKLSGRHGATALIDYQKDYLPEALLNFVGSLNYTYSKEVLSKEEMVQEFEIEKVHKSGAIFDIQKLEWFNTQYVRKLSPDQLREATSEPIPDAAVPMVAERLERLSHAGQYSFFWKDPEYASELLIWKSSPVGDVRKGLELVSGLLDGLNDLVDSQALRDKLDQLAKDNNLNRGLVYWPFRVALSGLAASPDPVDILAVIGAESARRRVRHALEMLGSS